MSIRSFQGHTPVLGEGVFIDETALAIGQVSIGDNSSLWPFVVARGDVHRIEIGSETNIQDGTVLHVTHDGPFAPGGFPLIIGDQVTVGHQAILHACQIGNRCLVGMGARVLDGAVLKDEVMVGAGSIVPPGKTLEGGFLYLGSPVKQIRALTPEEISYFQYSAKNYVALKNQHLAERDS